LEDLEDLEDVEKHGKTEIRPSQVMAVHGSSWPWHHGAMARPK
jgi:hypothetical protein